MKTETYISIANYIKAGKLDFPNDSLIIIFKLTRPEMTLLINTEYGIKSKKSRIIKKYLTRLINDLFKEILRDIKNEDLAI